MIANDNGFIKYDGNELNIIKDLIGLVYAIRTQGKKDFNPVTMAILDSGLKKILNDEFPTDNFSNPIMKEFNTESEMMAWAKANLKRS